MVTFSLIKVASGQPAIIWAEENTATINRSDCFRDKHYATAAKVRYAAAKDVTRTSIALSFMFMKIATLMVSLPLSLL